MGLSCPLKRGHDSAAEAAYLSALIPLGFLWLPRPHAGLTACRTCMHVAAWTRPRARPRAGRRAGRGSRDLGRRAAGRGHRAGANRRQCAYRACMPCKALLSGPEVRAEASRVAGVATPAIDWRLGGPVLHLQARPRGAVGVLADRDHGVLVG